MKNNRKLSVGLVFDDSLDSNDGVSQYVKTLGAWLSQQGHRVSYLVGETKLDSWGGGKVYSLAKNQSVYFNGNKLSVPWPAKPGRIKAVLDKEKFDVLHIMMPHSPFMGQKVINNSKSAAVVGTFHIYPANSLAKLGTSLLRLAYFGKLNKVSEVVSVSPAAQEFAAFSFKLKTTIVPNMVDISRFETNKVKAEPFRIVFLGRLVDRKGARQLIEAFSIVSKQVPQARLVIGGDGPQRPKLEALTQRLGLSEAVEFRGFIDETDKPQLLASAAIACFPSLYGESFGIVLIEAMAAGSGVVLAGDNPGYAGVMRDIPGALFNPREPTILAARILHILGDSQLFDSIHQKQASLVKKYDVSLVGAQIEELYARAIDKASKTRHN
jgi:phosphatidylinositol alpha-mannosyltransferase